jgi:hypothetical protein
MFPVAATAVLAEQRRENTIPLQHGSDGDLTVKQSEVLPSKFFKLARREYPNYSKNGPVGIEHYCYLERHIGDHRQNDVDQTRPHSYP